MSTCCKVRRRRAGPQAWRSRGEQRREEEAGPRSPARPPLGVGRGEFAPRVLTEGGEDHTWPGDLLGRPRPRPHREAGEKVAGRRRQLSRCRGARPGQRHPRVPLCDSARFRARVLAGRPGPACACAVPRVRARPTAAGRVEEGQGWLTRPRGRAGAWGWVRRRRGQPGILGSGAAADSPGSSGLVVRGKTKALGSGAPVWSQLPTFCRTSCCRSCARSERCLAAGSCRRRESKVSISLAQLPRHVLVFLFCS